jgi:DNA-binding transcriptional LysR family regulator
MDLRQLRYFAAIAEHASFRAAADDLRMAQPALSQQMRRLETELGVELFDRSTRPVRVTDAGEHLLPRARAILRDVERAAAEVRDFATEPRGRLAVGVMQYLTNLELPELLADFNRRYPLVELGLRVGNTGQLRDGLGLGDIDVVICHVDELGNRPELTVEPLRVEELVIVVALDDDRAGHESIMIESLADTPLITFRQGASMRDAMMAAFDRAGLTPNIAFEGPDMATTVGLVARGLGWALIPRSIAEREASVAALHVAPDPLTRQVALVWPSDRHRSRPLEAFRAMTHEAMELA